MSSTGNDPKTQKLQKKKTNFALLVAVGALVYVIVRNRDMIARGGASAVRSLGPVVSRVLPAIALGLLSMIAGPEGVILGVPVGLLFGPELIALASGGRISAAGASAGLGVAKAARGAAADLGVAEAASVAAV